MALEGGLWPGVWLSEQISPGLGTWTDFTGLHLSPVERPLRLPSNSMLTRSVTQLSVDSMGLPDAHAGSTV